MSRQYLAKSVLIIVEPSFSSKESVCYQEFYVDGVQHHVIGGVTALDRDFDPQSWDRELSKTEAKKLNNVLSRLAIALDLTSPPHGLDGTKWKVVITCGSNRIELEWRNHLPPSWGSLKELIDTMRVIAKSKEPPKWWEFWQR